MLSKTNRKKQAIGKKTRFFFVCTVYTTTLKIDAVYSTLGRDISEDTTLHNQRCENLKSQKNHCS
jgi:hypothetical protein